MFQFAPFMLHKKLPVQTLISRMNGIAIGDMTGGGGVSAAFDGTNFKTGSTCANTVGLGDSDVLEPWFVGKDWGNGNAKIITGFKIMSSSSADIGWKYSIAYNHTIRFTLWGHTSNTPNSATNLGSVSVANSVSSTAVKLTGLNETTAYRYHWIGIDTPAVIGDQNKYISQIEFYETI